MLAENVLIDTPVSTGTEGVLHFNGDNSDWRFNDLPLRSENSTLAWAMIFTPATPTHVSLCAREVVVTVPDPRTREVVVTVPDPRTREVVVTVPDPRTREVVVTVPDPRTREGAVVTTHTKLSFHKIQVCITL